MIVKGGFKHFNVGWFFLIFVVVVPVAALLLPNILGNIQRARESEVRTNLSSIAVSLKAYHKEYGVYSDDFRQIAFLPKGDLGTKYFLKKSDIPANLATHVRSGEEPFVKSNAFRVLAIMGKGPEVIFYTIDHEGNMDRRQPFR